MSWKENVSDAMRTSAAVGQGALPEILNASSQPSATHSSQIESKIAFGSRFDSSIKNALLEDGEVRSHNLNQAGQVLSKWALDNPHFTGDYEAQETFDSIFKDERPDVQTAGGYLFWQS